MQTENRLAEVNGEEEVTIDEQARRAQIVLESHRQSRILSAQQDLDALLKRHNVGLEIRQVVINGMPQQAQIVLVPNPG